MNYLTKNIEALSTYNKILSDELEKDFPESIFKPVHNKKEFNIICTAKSRPELVCVFKNPKKLASDTIKTKSLHKEDFTLVIGVGTGVILKTLLNRMEKGHHVVLIEKHVDLLKIVLSEYDFSSYIKTNSLMIFMPRDKADIAQIFGFIESGFVVQGWDLLSEEYTTRLFPEIYIDVMSHVTQIMNQMICNIGTVMGAGAQIAYNDIKNLPYVIKHRGVKELKDLYNGFPAVLVSTGPGLEKNIYLLMDKEVQKRVVIIAVAQAARILLAYGIRPDFICTVDFGKTNYEHFDGLMEYDFPLVVLNRTYDQILKEYQGPMFICSTPVPGFEKTSTHILTEKGSVEQGGSVAHLCFGLACHLGCDPITLIGQDLAYENDLKSHADGADASGQILIDKDTGYVAWNVTDPKSHLINEKVKSTYMMGQGIMVPGYWGTQVLTNSGLASFITSFETLALQNKEIKLFNSTEGGAEIKYFEQKLLSDFLNEFCIRPIDKEKINPLLSVADNGDDLIEKVIPLIKEDIKMFSDIIENCEKALETDDKIESSEDSEEVKELLKENEKYSQQAHELAKQNNLLGVAIYHASRNIFSRELNVDGKVSKLLKDKESLLTRIKRNRLILNAAKDSSIELKTMHETALDVLEKYFVTKDMSLLKEKPNKTKISLQDMKDFFAVGNWIRPIVELKTSSVLSVEEDELLYKAIELKDIAIEKAQKIQEDKDRGKLLMYNALIKKSLDAGRKDKNFEEAFSLLENAIELFPEKFEARWGKATTLFHVGKIQESYDEYTKLINDFPDAGIKLKFEKALVRIHLDLSAGLADVLEVMKDNEEYDYMLWNIGNLHERAGNDLLAVDCYEKYFEKYPYDIPARESLITLYTKLGYSKKLKKMRKDLCGLI